MKDDAAEYKNMSTLLQDAKQQQEHGESIVRTLKDPMKCGPYLESLTKSLSTRELALGRYHHVTAQSYAAIGNLLFHMPIEQPRAIVMYRTCYRIQGILYGGRCHGCISGKFQELLSKQGLKDKQVEGIQKDIAQSIRHEMEGDLLRRFGDRKGAVGEYRKAAKIEEFSFGRNNPDLAYLWRKMACLASIKTKNLIVSIDFNQVDRLDNKFIKTFQDSIWSSQTYAAIRRGDRYYSSLQYSQAVEEYLKVAATSSVVQQAGSDSKRNRCNRNRTPRTSNKKPSKQLLSSSMRELETLLGREDEDCRETNMPPTTASASRMSGGTEASQANHSQDLDSGSTRQADADYRKKTNEEHEEPHVRSTRTSRSNSGKEKNPLATSSSRKGDEITAAEPNKPPLSKESSVGDQDSHQTVADSREKISSSAQRTNESSWKTIVFDGSAPPKKEGIDQFLHLKNPRKTTRNNTSSLLEESSDIQSEFPVSPDSYDDDEQEEESTVRRGTSIDAAKQPRRLPSPDISQRMVASPTTYKSYMEPARPPLKKPSLSPGIAPRQSGPTQVSHLRSPVLPPQMQEENVLAPEDGGKSDPSSRSLFVEKQHEEQANYKYEMDFVPPTSNNNKKKKNRFSSGGSVSSTFSSDSASRAALKASHYLSKIASKTGKIAKRGVRRLKSSEERPESASSFFAPRQKKGSSAELRQEEGEQEVPLAEQLDEARPKSAPYLSLASPPPTPFTINEKLSTNLNFSAEALFMDESEEEEDASISTAEVFAPEGTRRIKYHARKKY